MESLRIITINTWKCDGAYRARIAWLVEELKRLQPDVVAAQECFRDLEGRFDTAGTLARELNLSLAWTPARFKERDCEGEPMFGWSGMALLSRRRWRRVDSIDLPADPRDGDRVAQIGELDWQGGVLVANLHLTHLRDADELRSRQLTTVLSHRALRDTLASRLLCGDFNTTSDGPVLAPLLQEREGRSLRDTFGLAGTPVAPDARAEPRRRVDYILSMAEREAAQPVFSSPSIVLDRPEPETGVLPSDHPGVAVTLLSLARGRWLEMEGAQFGK